MDYKPLRILLVAAEVAPFAKVGGMADVVGALPQALEALGHDVRVAMPRYAGIDGEKFQLQPAVESVRVPLDHQFELASVVQGRLDSRVPVYLIGNDQYFGREKVYGYPDDDRRFIFFSRATLETMKALDWQPDIIHCNDWHTAIIPNWLKTIYADDPFYSHAASVYTIHNLAYQGILPAEVLRLAGIDKWGLICPDVAELGNLVDLMGRGIYYADAVNTVSERYAQEILTPEYGEKLDGLLRSRKDHLFGILNGIDTQVFDPATDKYITANYDVDSLAKRVENKRDLQRICNLPVNGDAPLVGMVSRLARQKGFDLLEQIIVPLLRLNEMQFVLLGTGEPMYEDIFGKLAGAFPDKAHVSIKFDVALAQKIYAGSDMFLMPSKFEPCGLGQMIAMRYGSVPVVRATGGLADTVGDFDPRTSTGNGFVFTDYDQFALFGAMARGLESFKYRSTWQELMRRDMRADYSWGASARKYVELYERAGAFRRGERKS